jgi:predicted DNA-binding protein
MQYIQAVIGPGDNKMATQIIIRIASEVKDRLSKLTRMEGKTPSQMVRELIEDYIKEQNIGTYIDDLTSVSKVPSHCLRRFSDGLLV